MKIGRSGIQQIIGLVGFLLVAVGAARAGSIIVEGDTWRYFKGTSFPGATWNTNGFDDSSWLTGPSGFGFGDGDDATVLSDMLNSYVSVFTRKTFNIANPGAVTRLVLAADYDDGFVAYINGVEVARRTMAAGVPTNTTVASGNHEASLGDSTPQPKEFIVISTAPLVAGENVLAVSGHNVSAGSSDFSLIIELYSNVALTRGPYIQMPNSNEVTIVWRTDVVSDSVVEFGFDTNYTGGMVSNAALVTEHVVSIPGLVAGTNYFYRVRSNGETLSEGGFFRTKRADGQPFRFVALGDWGSPGLPMTDVAGQINNVADLDFYITTGDNIYDNGEVAYYDSRWFKLYSPTLRRVPVFPTLGNHDIGTAGGQPFVDNFYLPQNGPAGQLERNYSFDYGNAHFVAIDSNPFDNSQTATINAIKTWLSNDLASTSQPWKFVYFHHPPYTSQGSHNDNESVKTNLMPVVEAAGVQFVFDGHNHFYERINAINGSYHIITGAGGRSLYTLTNRKVYSAVNNNTIHSFTIVDMNGTHLKLRQIDKNGVQLDEFNLDIGHPFKIDGLLDDPSWVRADNGVKLYAAIRGNYLYVATQDAGEGGDNFIYVNNVLSTNRAANWAKAGQVMQWNCFVADENDNAFQRWYGQTEQFLTNYPAFQSMTSGLNNNGTFGNGVLEGTVNLATRFGTFPQQLYLAAAAFGNANGGSLTAQVPAGNGDGNIQSNEFLAVNARDITLDLPIANAGPPGMDEAGMTIVLDGTGSSAPSGLPMSFDWVQTDGPAVVLVNSNAPMSYFASTFNVSSNTVLTFRLTVNDTRFDSNATTTVTLTPMVDTDGDGLSDAEELTGQDNILTVANPNGQITNPLNPDTDGDGASDSDEAIAGTNPNSAASVFRITSIAIPGVGFNLEWTTVTGKTYVVDFRDDLGSAWSPLTNVVASSVLTNITDTSAAGQPQRFYQVRVLP